MRPTRRLWPATPSPRSAPSSPSPRSRRRGRRRNRQALCRGYRRPQLHAEARERFAAKKNLRLVEVHAAPAQARRHNVSGGLLLQDADTGHITAAELEVVTQRPPTAEELRSLLFAWRVCKHVKSNAIVYASDGQTLGVGAGQMSRVDAARFGAMKAVLPFRVALPPPMLSSPFPMALKPCPAGATAVIQPGGSVTTRKSSKPRTS